MCGGDGSGCGVRVTLTVAVAADVASPSTEQDAWTETFEQYLCEVLQLMGACESITVAVGGNEEAVANPDDGTVNIEAQIEIEALSTEQKTAVLAAEGSLESLSDEALLARLTLAASENAVNSNGSTSDSESLKRRLMATTEDTGSIVNVGDIERTFVCGDRLCAVEERPVAGETDAGGHWCAMDCPYPLGSCPAPGSTEAGDQILVRYHISLNGQWHSCSAWN